MPHPIDDAALDQLFRTARSFNGFTDAPVTEADIRAIYELVKLAPTSANQQPGRFVWITTHAAKARLAQHASANNKDKILAAPASVVIAYDTEFHEHLGDFFPHVDAKPWFAEPAGRERTAFLNTTLQAGYFILAARALGFDTGPMTGYDNAALDADFFGDRPGYKSVMISTLGRGDPASIFPRLPRPDFARFNTIA